MDATTLPPGLNPEAQHFGVSYERASLIPQLLQAGYGGGILLLCPLGDVFRLRPMILILLTITTVAWAGLCLTDSFQVFTALSFVTGFVTVSPQLLLPLVGTITAPDRQATAVSIVLAGGMMGLAVPRAALGLQVLLIAAMWLFFPDYPLLRYEQGASPESNPYQDHQEDRPWFRTYTRVLLDIVRMVFTKPILAHGCAVTFLTNAVLTAFWTTLTAHLVAPPRNFGPYLVIENFAIYVAAVAGMVPGIATVALDAYAGERIGGGVGGAVIQAVGVDFGIHVASVAYRAAVYRELPATKANVTFTFSAFIGQLVGTSVGNVVYARGGWAQVGTLNIALSAGATVVVLSRGPKEKGWFGWTGGASLRLKDGSGTPANMEQVQVV
ncbi:major facilitator superfamily domain-containing protein [Chaetomium tenue]|uniref:Major facilitator superfamily domain-containing protein n=1 Tax=Chaetomium tenue TaxID=1854479 RepID=A0ACB7PB25_9PEZI|nr:major facilitator superfamily domain-containing protein [Chaetomium globosum]